MAKPRSSNVDAVLERVRGMAMVFPAAEEKLSYGAPSFHVRGRMFLVFSDNHHNDGRLAVVCKASIERQREMVSEDPTRFYVPPYFGVKGWLGVRLDQPQTDWVGLSILMEEGYLSVVPPSIARGTARKPPPPRKPPPRRPTTDKEVARIAFERLSTICMALPEATCERSGAHASFHVGKKVFAYFFDNHHGDEIIGACAKVPKGENAKMARAEPKRFYLPAYIASRGWVGERLDVKRVDWKGLRTRITQSYASVAPKRLLVAD